MGGSNFCDVEWNVYSSPCGRNFNKKLFVHRMLRMLIAYISWSVMYLFYNIFVLGMFMCRQN